MSPSLTNITILLLFFFTNLSSSSSACNSADQTALLAFKNASPAGTFPNWATTTDCCFWDGVGCTSGRVTSLSFTSGDDYSPADLNGSIPPSIGDLSKLNLIYFASFPHLKGPLPSQLANLKSTLQYITIYNTSVSGTVPSYLSTFAGLIELNLPFNEFSGTVPASLGTLAKLTTIDLSTNNLTGTIPSSLFGALAAGASADLDLSHNGLTGAIPESFASVKWANLDVSYNMLCGQIPSGGSYVPADGSGFAGNKCLCGTPLPACT